jgi:hypothetical protein
MARVKTDEQQTANSGKQIADSRHKKADSTPLPVPRSQGGPGVLRAQ